MTAKFKVECRILLDGNEALELDPQKIGILQTCSIFRTQQQRSMSIEVLTNNQTENDIVVHLNLCGRLVAARIFKSWTEQTFIFEGIHTTCSSLFPFSLSQEGGFVQLSFFKGQIGRQVEPFGYPEELEWIPLLSSSKPVESEQNMMFDFKYSSEKPIADFKFQFLPTAPQPLPSVSQLVQEAAVPHRPLVVKLQNPRKPVLSQPVGHLAAADEMPVSKSKVRRGSGRGKGRPRSRGVARAASHKPEP